MFFMIYYKTKSPRMKSTEFVFLIVLIFIVICVGITQFYREPVIKRTNFDQNTLYSPCYGIVQSVLHNKERKLKMISIFLRVSDIHSQYYPISGSLISREVIKGKYKMATKIDNVANNARTITKVKTERGDIIKIEQISGILARKISSGPQKVGAEVNTGDYLGRIHLGSRVNITFPDTWESVVQIGQYVAGPDTELAKLKIISN